LEAISNRRQTVTPTLGFVSTKITEASSSFPYMQKHVRKKERGNGIKMQFTMYILVYQKCFRNASGKYTQG
jgi:hypothetical protein